ncbi:MAG: AAC(3) family N-acetyltransferase [Proteobacteria bacterium]|nr:AAC(3) family N-acetyltransferase [Pseudomonadota bacterium]
MRTPSITRAGLTQHLAGLGVRAGMHVAVHSRLLSFGRVEGGAAAVYEALCEAVGPEGTVVVPTFTFYLESADVYDPATTPSQEVGALPEYVRTQPGVLRTLCPMHSHAVIGADTAVLAGADPERSLGKGSSFDAMHAAGFHLLLLGCTFLEGATFLHQVEASVGVPYRSWLHLPRRVRMPDGSERGMDLRHYGMEKGTRLEKNFVVAERAMAARPGAMTSVALGGRSSHLMTLATLYDVVAGLLAADPLALMTDPGDGG